MQTPMLQKMQDGTIEFERTLGNDKSGKTGLVVMGKTSGKTTLCYFLTNRPLTKMQSGGRWIFDVASSERHRNATISQEVETPFHPPNIFPTTRQNEFVVDSSSFCDHNELEANLLSYFFTRQIFQRLESIRFVLTISMGGLNQAKMVECTSTLKRFLSFFVLNREFTVQTLASSVVLVITGCDNSPATVQNTYKRLQTVRDTTELDSIAELLEQLINHKRVLMFKSPENYQRDEGLRMYSDIMQLTSPWTRPLVNGNISMDNVDVRILMNLLSPNDKKLAADFLATINKWVISLCMMIAGTVEKFVNKVTKGVDHGPLLQGWDKTISEIPTFNKNLKLHLKAKRPPNYFAQLKFIQEVWRCVDEKLKETPNYKQVIELSTDLLRAIAGFLRLSRQELDLLDSVAYLLHQKVEESRLVFVNLGKELNFGEAMVRLSTYREIAYEAIELDFFQHYHPENRDAIEYYEECKAYIKKSLNADKSLLSKLSLLEELQAKNMAGKLPPGERERLLINSIINIEEHDEAINREFFVKCETDKYRTLAVVSFNAELYDQAKEMFKVLNDVERVEECLNLLIKANPRSFELYLEKAVYFRDQTLFESARLAFLEALCLAPETKKQDVRDSLLDCDRNKQQYQQKFIKRLENSEYYNRRNPNFDFYSISKKLAAKIPLAASIDINSFNVGPVPPPPSASLHQPITRLGTTIDEMFV